MSAQQDDVAAEPADEARRQRFGTLPDRILPEDVVATREALTSPDPDLGAAWETERVLHNAG